MTMRSALTHREQLPEQSNRRTKNGLGRLLGRKRGQPKQQTQQQQQQSVFRVVIPNGLRAGDTFQAYVGDQIVRVRCPPDAQAGSTITIKAPKATDENDLPFNSPGVKRAPNCPGAFLVEIPHNVQGGERFRVAHRRYEYAFRERATRNLGASKGAKVNK